MNDGLDGGKELIAMTAASIAVWSTIGGVVLMAAVLFLVIATLKLAVLGISGIAASGSAKTRGYVDEWVSVAKIGGIGIALVGLGAFTEDMIAQSSSSGSTGAIGALLGGAALYAIVPEAVRLLRHRKVSRGPAV